MSCGRAGILLALCVTLAACNTFRPGGDQPATLLAPQPVTPVQSEPLWPPPGTLVEEETWTAADVARTNVPTRGVEVTAGDLAGGWRLTSGGETCGLFTSQTTWTGGFRASTRGCSSPILSSISAWKVNGGQVQLFDGEGKQVASLFGSSRTQFNGQTATGQAISFTR